MEQTAFPDEFGCRRGAAQASNLASPNDTVRVACVGVMGKIIDHVQPYLRMKNVEIAAICDVDESVLDRRLAEVERAGKKRPARFVDIRKVLEDKIIDAVSIATPNHSTPCRRSGRARRARTCTWRSRARTTCSRRGRLWRRRRSTAAWCSTGRNQRSEPAVQEAVEQLRDGVIGDVYMARGLCFKWRDTIGRKPDEPVPAGVNYDLWLGPAPKHAFTRNRFHYNLHWFWDYGNGDIGNQGLHQIDVARWGLGVTYPTKVSATGGHFMFDDDQETPNTITATFEFNEGGKKKLLVADVRHWITNREANLGADGPFGIGDIFYGSNGYLGVEATGKYFSFIGKDQKPGPAKRESGNHWANFIGARAQPQVGGPERPHYGGRRVHRAGAPGEYLLPAGAR